MIGNKFFKPSEFLCPCCGKEEMRDDFIDRLTSARIIANIPFYIISGYRCEKYNKKVGGVSNSAHMLGTGSDILADASLRRFLIFDALRKAGFTRLGLGKSFIHADIDLKKPQNVIWTYYKKNES